MAVALLLGGCAVEHGNRPPAQAAAQPSGAGAGAPGTMAPALPGPMHQVFDSLRERVAIGVDRLSLSVMLNPEAPRADQQATLQAVADLERRADSTLGAIRVLGFYPPPPGHGAHPDGGMRLIPSAVLLWTPPGGWDATGRASLHAPHTVQVQFVADLPNHHPAPGAGTGR
jgi:hypothetical protein